MNNLASNHSIYKMTHHPQRDEENPEFLRIENVTFEHTGWYTCVAANSLGQANESAYLNVVDRLEDPVSIPLPAAHFVFHPTTIVFLSVFFFVSLIITICVWKKYSKTKKLQRQMERVNQWTKRVVVVQACIDNGNTGMSDSFVSLFQFVHIRSITQNPLLFL